MSFAVWAPHARRVELALDDRSIAMAPSGRGWWQADTPQRPGSRYGFCLDGGEPLPDPRSRWQPDGVLERSGVPPSTRFTWSDDGFRPRPWEEAILYELHVGTFTAEGTFRGAIERLPYLAELGITHLELMPIAAFSGVYGWGYDGVALFAPHPAYGAPDDLKALVDACHRAGLAVLFDVVHNHLGPEGNFLPRFGPYLSDRHRTPWGAAMNLDGPDSGEVRRHLIESALAWLDEYHGDGLRLDAVHALIDLSPLHFLEELRRDVDKLARRTGRPLLLVAESDANDPRLVRPPTRGGFGLDAMWNDDFHHALHVAATGESDGYYADYGGLHRLVATYRRGFAYAGEYAPSRRRRHGRPVSDLDGRQLVAFAQNHDQVGNRARGDRLSSSLGLARLRLVAGLLFTAPFVPLLFQGEEWGASTPFPFFCDFRDASLRASVADARRREFAAFGWDPADVPDATKPETFVSAKLRWAEQEAGRHRALRDWARELIRLRREIPDLRASQLGPDAAEVSSPGGSLRLVRGAHLVVANLSERPSAVDVGARRSPVLATEGVSLAGDAVALPVDGFAILSPPA